MIRTIPYVTDGEFRRHPTFLDTGNLVSAGSAADQDAALLNALLTASQWADQHLYGHDGSIAAHTRVENARCRPDRDGRLKYHPEHTPVLTVVSIATGADPAHLTSDDTPNTWLEQDGRIIVAYPTAAAPGLDRLQFGRPSVRGELLTTWTYVAGWAATQLAAPAAAGDNTVQVLDATGITAGTVLRVWTPGLEEAVTVQAVTATTLTLAAPLARAHQAGDSIQALPPTIREAIVNKTICELLRPNTTTQQQAASGMSSTSTSKDPSRSSGGGRYHEKACGLLRPFHRIR